MPVVAALRRRLFSGRNYLPKGQSLPEDIWRFRHRCLGWLLRARVAVVFVFGVVRGHGALHSGTEAGAIAVCAVLAAGQARRQFAAAMTAVGLILASAVIVHQSGGLIEAHFHFFVMVGILTLYAECLGERRRRLRRDVRGADGSPHRPGPGPLRPRTPLGWPRRRLWAGADHGGAGRTAPQRAHARGRLR